MARMRHQLKKNLTTPLDLNQLHLNKAWSIVDTEDGPKPSQSVTSRKEIAEISLTVRFVHSTCRTSDSVAVKKTTF